MDPRTHMGENSLVPPPKTPRAASCFRRFACSFRTSKLKWALLEMREKNKDIWVILKKHTASLAESQKCEHQKLVILK